LRGQSSTIVERMRVDTSAFLPLPPAPYDACHKVARRVSSLSPVRYRNNDCSVPTRHGHQEVLAKGYVDMVEIACRGETIATHVRSYDRFSHLRNAGMRIGVRRDNQGENPATMRMRMRRCTDDEGRAEPDWSRRHPSDLRPFGCLLLDRAMPVLCCPIAGGEERFHPMPR
jgi:hypothetical protein